MSKLIMVNGVAERKAKIGDLENGDVFEHQGDVYMVLASRVSATKDRAADTMLLGNLSKYTITALHKGTEVFKVEAELVLK